MAILIDDGIPSRSQRKAFFHPAFTRFACFHGPHLIYKYMTVCLYCEIFDSKLEPMIKVRNEELQEFMSKPVEFPYVPDDYTSYTEKTTFSNDKGFVIKTAVRTF